MLLNLYVKNMALIDEIEVTFKEGLNILTGETGAGKSIIIGSVNMALGGKVPKDIVGSFGDYGMVELVFSVDEDMKNIISSMDIETDDDMQLIISRKITGGKSIIKVNGETWTATRLRELTSLLIDVHGQHDHQSLLHKNKHLEILDEFAMDKLGKIKEEYSEKYREYRELLKRRDDFNMDEEQRLRELSFLEYELNEIDDADLKSGEDEELEKDYKYYSNQGKITESLSNAYEMLAGKSGGNISEYLSSAIKELMSVSEYDEELKDYYNSLVDMEDICNELSRSVNIKLSDMSFDEERADMVTKRLDLINKLKLKHGKTIEDILNARDEYRQKYEELKDYDNARKMLESQIEQSENQLGILAGKITDIRKKASKELEKLIVNTLMNLNFLEVRFNVEFEQLSDFSNNGLDSVQFLISTNPGESLKPLKDIASGGELSRIMLGIKTILAGKDEIDTLIFDEIDTGISGKTAQLVSEKLSLISKNHQVICITHLPQIAAMADAHYVIEKKVVSDKTKTLITGLDKDGEIEELARMLGGAQVSEATFDNAREMKKFAILSKNKQD